MTVAFLGPGGVNSVQLSNPNNKSKVVDAADLALDSVMKGRVGTGGGLSFRNKIIDGRFDFWYEGTSQTANGYGSATMWLCSNVGTTKTHSQQALVAGVDLPCIDVPSAKYFSRTVVSSVAGVNNFANINQNIEDVTAFAGKTVTLSFYAKANAVKNIAVCLSQGMGTGGSANVLGIGAQLLSLSTSWQRYSVQISIPSLSGKTIGAGNNILQLSLIFDAGSTFAASYGISALGQQSGTFDIACVQLEEGSVATPFEELPIEISAKRVNRFFQPIVTKTQSNNGRGYTNIFPVVGSGNATDTRAVICIDPMRADPSLLYSGTMALHPATITVTSISVVNSESDYTTGKFYIAIGTTSTITAGVAQIFRFSASPAGSYMFLDARL